VVILNYTNENGRVIEIELTNWDATETYLNTLSAAPIDLVDVNYHDTKTNEQGYFSLITGEKTWA
jgi:hypothetical protein